jgi:hypothetical protein
VGQELAQKCRVSASLRPAGKLKGLTHQVRKAVQEASSGWYGDRTAAASPKFGGRVTRVNGLVIRDQILGWSENLRTYTARLILTALVVMPALCGSWAFPGHRYCVRACIVSQEIVSIALFIFLAA